MKIGVISDSHDRLSTLRRALTMFRRMNVEAVLHAGDFIAPFAAKVLIGPDSPCEKQPGAGNGVPLYCVYGNNDGEREGLKLILPQVQDGPLHLRLGGRHIVMHHWIEWIAEPDLQKAEIVITGHTHEVVCETRDGRMLLNPGECCGWVNDRCTVALLDTEQPSAEIIEIHDHD